MTRRSPNFLRDPQIQFLQTILDELRDGLIQLPRFQRPFVWSIEQQLELLRSVRDGLPIGSVMLWRTQRTRVACAKLVGTRRVREPAEDGVRQYLLDGQQRLATLLMALTPAPNDDPQETTFCLDLNGNDFCLVPTGDVALPLLPLWQLMESLPLRKAIRSFPDSSAETWTSRADDAATAFLEYKIPVVPIVTDDTELAVRTFERVNSQGTQMSTVHMVHALSWGEGFDLVESVRDLREKYLAPVGWYDLDDERVLDVCKARLGLDLVRPNAERLGEELRASPTLLEESIVDLQRTARFLAAECCVFSPRLVPYRQQIAAIALALRAVTDIDAAARGRLVAWFWVTTYTEYFSGEGFAAGQRLRDALGGLADVLRGSEAPNLFARGRRALGPGFNVLSARSKALVLCLSSLRPRGLDGDEVPLASMLAGSEVRVPWMVSRSDAPSAYGSPANRVLLPRDQMEGLRDRLRRRDVSWIDVKQIAESHAITESARSALQARDHVRFLELRRDELERLEDLLFQSMLSTFHHG